MNENNEYIIFEEYAKHVCKKIMSVRKRREVREELYSHLLEEYDRNCSLGLDDLSAQQKAVDKMGDKEKLADTFGKLYSIIPTEYMRSSVNFIIWGFLLTHFHIDLFEGFAQITTFLGQALLLFGLFKLRKADKKLNYALYLYIFIHSIEIVINAISYNLANPNRFVTVSAIFLNLINIILYWWIFSGLNRLCKTTLTENDKTPHLVAGFINFVLFSSNVIFAFLLEANELALFSPIFLIFTIVQLCRAKNVLAHEEPEFNLNDTIYKSEKIIYGILVVVFAITPIIAMIGSSASSPDYEVFNAVITSVSQSEVEAAKKNMIELGFNEEYLKDITDSEILKYADATCLQIEEPRSIHREEYDFKANTMNKIVVCETQTFRFFFPDDEIRILMRVEMPDEKTCKYRNGLYLQFYNDYFTPKYNDNENNCEKFEVVLSELEGQTISTTPLSYFNPENSNDLLYIAGFEFKFVKGSTNRRAYLAHSSKISRPEIIQNTCTDGVFLWEEIPLSAEYQSINSKAIAEFDGSFFFGGSGIDEIHRWELYDSFSYDPSYKTKDENVDFSEQ